KVTGVKLADRWPDSGPPRLWSRPLGDGYSGIVGDESRVYTMYRAEAREVVVALDTRSGKTLWEQRYPAPYSKGHSAEYSGRIPSATPVMSRGRLYTIGYTAKVHCFDAASGKVLWACDLIKDHGGKIQEFGYCASPLVYEDTLVALLGGKADGV